MLCDMCGTDKGPFYTGKVESTTMNVCEKCKRYAKDATLLRTAPKTTKKEETLLARNDQPQRGEFIQIITPGYARLIKNAREKRGLKQEQLAKQLAEKESLLHALESGKHPPSMELARKLEKHLGITLVIQHEEKHEGTTATKKGPLTIGDLLRPK